MATVYLIFYYLTFGGSWIAGWAWCGVISLTFHNACMEMLLRIRLSRRFPSIAGCILGALMGPVITIISFLTILSVIALICAGQTESIDRIREEMRSL